MKTGKTLKPTQHGKHKINVTLLLMEAQNQCYVITRGRSTMAGTGIQVDLCLFCYYTKKIRDSIIQINGKSKLHTTYLLTNSFVVYFRSMNPQRDLALLLKVDRFHGRNSTG